MRPVLWCMASGWTEARRGGSILRRRNWGSAPIRRLEACDRSRAELVRDPKSVVRGVLWLNRACSFITEFVAQLAAGRLDGGAQLEEWVRHGELSGSCGHLTDPVAL